MFTLAVKKVYLLNKNKNTQLQINVFLLRMSFEFLDVKCFQLDFFFVGYNQRTQMFVIERFFYDKKILNDFNELSLLRFHIRFNTEIIFDIKIKVCSFFYFVTLERSADKIS